jgi:hypothetical protein
VPCRLANPDRTRICLNPFRIFKETAIHPTIAYHLAQERSAELRRHARIETLTSAAIAGETREPRARRAQVAGPGCPQSQSRTGLTLAKLELFMKPIRALGRLASVLVRLASLSRRPSRSRPVTHAAISLSVDGSLVSRQVSVTPLSNPSTSGSGIPSGPAGEVSQPYASARCAATARPRSSC